MLGIGASAGAVVVLTPKWDQRFASGFLQNESGANPMPRLTNAG
jgi:hypothetical protein